ncbi:hypothetical protein PRVXH_001077 [Proteinivorax hydrogeniformans]|uniref:DRTGG domain-containing protein n=1 Tax=Proteinivorax hydrogeniformans TaxID=1826727 RepID=A0AAU8HWK0_9FIRM
MKLKDVAKKLNLKELNSTNLEIEVKGGLSTDLLSLVLANSSPGSIWVTHQNHPNIIAVSLLAELSAIIVIGKVEKETVDIAKEKGVNLFFTNKPLFDTVGCLYSLGIKAEDATV